MLSLVLQYFALHIYFLLFCCQSCDICQLNKSLRGVQFNFTQPHIFRRGIAPDNLCGFLPGGRGGGGVLPEKLGRGVQPASQNPYPIYDQTLRYSLPYL